MATPNTIDIIDQQVETFPFVRYWCDPVQFQCRKYPRMGNSLRDSLVFDTATIHLSYFAVCQEQPFYQLEGGL